jgi:hypothetical protein
MRPDVEITMRLLERLTPADADPELELTGTAALLAALEQSEFDLWGAADIWLDGD